MRKKLNKENPKSIEISVGVPVTKTSFMSLIVILLVALMGYAGFLGANSIWKFTHPQFNVSLDSLKSLGYIAKGVAIPPIAGPTLSDGFNIPEDKTASYLQSLEDFKNEFRIKHQDSKLLQIPDTDLLNLGWSLCKAKDAEYSKSGAFDEKAAIMAMKAKFVLRYWQIDGLSEFLDGVSARALQNLCGGN